MELPDTTKVGIATRKAAQKQDALEGGASFLMRLWAYGGPGQPMNVLTFDSDPEIQQLIRSLIPDGQGRIQEQRPDSLVAYFADPLYALAAAKTLQQRLLTFHRSQPPQQVVASILISEWKSQNDAVGAILPAAQTPANGNYTAQILVSEPIYELARNKPGFQFNPKPVVEAGEGSSAEATYELLWTDESTYGHLREAGQSTGIQTAGRYQIQGELGRGAMGIVYRAYDQVIGRTVALKTISIDHNAPNRRELIERLKREAKAAGGLDHPNIITIYDVGQEDDRVYLSMQFIEGQTLQALLAEARLPPLPTLISYAKQICSAVGFAHARGVIHRDLKPANLMLTSQGVIKVLDFGIAKVEDATLTQTGLVVGTPTYMAPEQAADKKIDQRTDIFALGSVFYELFTLEKPFKGDVTTVLYKIIHEDPLPPSIINPALPGRVDAIIRKALAKNPKDRFQSCEEMGKAFAEQAALLPPPSTSAVAAGKTIVPAKQPSDPIPSYLLETTAVKPVRRIWPPLLTVLLLAAAGAAGYAYYVKWSTGAFPPLPEKLVAAWHRVIPQRASEPSNINPPAVNASSDQTGSTASANKSANSGADSSTTPNGADPAAQSTAGTTQSSSAISAGDKGQPAAGNSALSTTVPPADGDPAQKLPENAVSSPAQPSNGPQDASARGQNQQSQSGPGTSDPSDAATSPDSIKTSAAPAQPVEPAPNAAPKKPAKTSASTGPGPTVEGFTRRDVPELLRQADAAAGRGDYRLARYEYDLILKIERNNEAARTGLRRVQSAESDKSSH